VKRYLIAVVVEDHQMALYPETVAHILEKIGLGLVPGTLYVEEIPAAEPIVVQWSGTDTPIIST
jgi:hypothetical protein